MTGWTILSLVGILFLSAVIVRGEDSYMDACTTMAFSPQSTVDGSSAATHTADCGDCDFRLALVQGKRHESGAKTPVHPIRLNYPRYVGYDRGAPFFPENLEQGPQFYKWNITQAVGSIPEAEHTYSYLDGLYGIMNEHQVGFGEATCGAKLVARPVHAGGKALFDMSALTRIAMQRARTAREAVLLIGNLAEKHGFYGAAWEGKSGDVDLAIMEAGEALSVVDPNEAWVFHVLPDDTGASAVWAAQRVPEGHVAVVANDFTIKEINLDDPKNFLASSNVYQVALRKGFWSPDQGPLNFREVYGAPNPWEVYCSRRMWRVFSVLAPSLNLNPDSRVRELPFSVKPEKLVSVEQIMQLQRDHYEGTVFDLTKGLAAGPFGNPNRYDRGEASGTPIRVLQKGNFERPISMFRTSYSFVAQARAHLPREVGARVLFGMAAPHSTVYVPFFPSATELHRSFSTGSLFRFRRDSMWWAVTAIQNWAERAYSLISQDVAQAQHQSEGAVLAAMPDVEGQVRDLLSVNQHAARQLLTEFQEATAEQLQGAWWALFEHLIAKYRDGYRVDDFSGENIKQSRYFYPQQWLKAVGYYKPELVAQLPDVYPTDERGFPLPGVESLTASSPAAAAAAVVRPAAADEQLTTAQAQQEHGFSALALVAAVLAGVVAGAAIGVRLSKRSSNQYESIPSAETLA